MRLMLQAVTQNCKKVLKGAAMVLSLMALSPIAEGGFSESLILVDSQKLAEMSSVGAAFGDQVSSEIYSQLVADLELELKSLQPIESDGPVIHYFRPEWLSSPNTSFALIGIINRVDRVIFGETPCGEVRSVYRLSYKLQGSHGTRSSFLPMSVSLVYDLPAHSSASQTNPCSQSAKFADVPLAIARRQLRPKALEVNIQESRWGFSGRDGLDQSRYLLRSYDLNVNEGKISVRPLENTPDVERIRQSPELKAELQKWLTDPVNSRLVAEGKHLIPRKFLANRALSISPIGTKRKANRLFSQLFIEKDFASAAKPRLLLERLNQHTCVGCHQSMSVAGFHLLGDDSKFNADGPKLQTYFSPHLQSVLSWRQRFVDQFLEDQTLLSQPLPMRPSDQKAGQNGTCRDSTDCDRPLKCLKTFPSAVDSHFGICVRPTIQKSIATIGEPCEQSTLISSNDSAKDRIKNLKMLSCRVHLKDQKNGVCSGVKAGFPNGACSAVCTSHLEDSACIPTPIFGTYSVCTAQGYTFADCLEKNSVKALWPRCASTIDCREDYVCMSIGEMRGACVPTYFLPQLNIENHPRVGNKVTK